MGIYGIVLASGMSQRMGQQKLLLTWKNKTIIEHVLSQLVSIPLKGVHVVVPKSNKKLQRLIERFHYTTILNSNPIYGMGYSLRLAVESIPNSAEAIIILQGDQPTISPIDINRVIKAYRQLQGKLEYCPKTIIQMKYRDGIVGHPVLFSKHFFQQLAQIDGDKGGREIIKENIEKLLFCESENNYPNDIDTSLDYYHLIT